MSRTFAVACALGLSALLAAGVAQAQPNRCADLQSLQVAGLTVKITRTETVPAGPAALNPIAPAGPKVMLPAFCHVEGMIDERVGAGGRTYGIGFAIALPEAWNGRFLFQGGGGLDGILALPTGYVASGGKPALARGFAVASTDSGHRSTHGVFDSTFFADQQAVIDFEYASIGQVAKLAKQAVTSYYGKPPHHSYFTGCSMGGRESMVAAQRYPLVFDGVITGAPAMHVAFSGIGDRFAAASIVSLAPRGPDGKPDLSKGLSDSDRKLVVDGLLKACDAQDGVKDGMIFDIGACKFDPAILVCRTRTKTDACLTKAQAAAIRKAFEGARNSAGRQVYPGFYYDTGIDAKGFIPGLLNPTENPMGPPVFATEINVDGEEAKAGADPVNAVGDTANWTLMSTFFGRGGKQIFFHGVSDPWFSAKDTVEYYQRLAAANGGMTKLRAEDARLFLVPGMSHCGGGAAALDNFDLLTPLVSWVEDGKAPDTVVATGVAFPGRSRPLCPWPEHAQYNGTGDAEDSRNFTCRE